MLSYNSGRFNSFFEPVFLSPGPRRSLAAQPVKGYSRAPRASTTLSAPATACQRDRQNAAQTLV